jgi:coproporphyrinogen III oxidase-like Fe-S oxidoreductase
MDRTDEESFGSNWLAVLAALEVRGFVPADLVNYALPGRMSRYLRTLLLRRPLLGLGPGAASFRNPERSRNVSEWWEYRSGLASGEMPVAGRERLSRDESRMERIWYRLQTSDGLRLPRRLGDLDDLLAAWVDAGWAVWNPPRLRLTPEGWLRVDGLAVELASRLPTPRRERMPP